MWLEALLARPLFVSQQKSGEAALLGYLLRLLHGRNLLTLMQFVDAGLFHLATLFERAECLCLERTMLCRLLSFSLLRLLVTGVSFGNAIDDFFEGKGEFGFVMRLG